jgi:hypothetical protein
VAPHIRKHRRLNGLRTPGPVLADDRAEAVDAVQPVVHIRGFRNAIGVEHDAITGL